jgi:hypothetical protein
VPLDRLNQIDLRLVKHLRLKRTRVELQFDWYNVLNDSSITVMNTRYGPVWQRPLQIIDGSFFKFGTQVTF